MEERIIAILTERFCTQPEWWVDEVSREILAIIKEEYYHKDDPAEGWVVEHYNFALNIQDNKQATIRDVIEGKAVKS